MSLARSCLLNRALSVFFWASISASRISIVFRATCLVPFRCFRQQRLISRRSHDAGEMTTISSVGANGQATKTPQVADAGFVDRAEIVLAVRMVVFVESLEAADLRQQRATLIERHGFAGGDHHGR